MECQEEQVRSNLRNLVISHPGLETILRRTPPTYRRNWDPSYGFLSPQPRNRNTAARLHGWHSRAEEAAAGTSSPTPSSYSSQAPSTYSSSGYSGSAARSPPDWNRHLVTGRESHIPLPASLLQRQQQQRQHRNGPALETSSSWHRSRPAPASSAFANSIRNDNNNVDTRGSARTDSNRNVCEGEEEEGPCMSRLLSDVEENYYQTIRTPKSDKRSNRGVIGALRPPLISDYQAVMGSGSPDKVSSRLSSDYQLVGSPLASRSQPSAAETHQRLFESPRRKAASGQSNIPVLLNRPSWTSVTDNSSTALATSVQRRPTTDRELQQKHPMVSATVAANPLSAQRIYGTGGSDRTAYARGYNPVNRNMYNLQAASPTRSERGGMPTRRIGVEIRQAVGMEGRQVTGVAKKQPEYQENIYMEPNRLATSRRANTQLDLLASRQLPQCQDSRPPAAESNQRLEPAEAGIAGSVVAGSLSLTLKKGLLWSQRNRIFSRWKERYFVLTADYLQCFKKGTSRISEMGTFLYKVRLSDVERTELEDRRGYYIINILLQGEDRILLRRTEATRDWFTAITEAANRSRERRAQMLSSRQFWSRKQFTDTETLQNWAQTRRNAGDSPRLDSPLGLIQARSGLRRGVSPLTAPYSPLSPHQQTETDSGVDSLLTSLSDSSSNYSHYRNNNLLPFAAGDPVRGRPS